MSILRLSSDKNLILTGYYEPNTPRIGLQVAQQLGRKFVDVEQEIENMLGDTADNIREQYGERRLKAVEDQVLDNVVLYRNAVIRINGSTLATTERQAILLQTGMAVCLVARLDAVLQRLHVSLGSRYHNPNARGLELGHLRREWAVRKLKNLKELDVTYRNEDGIIQDILTWWQEVAVVRG
jgi:shikimate kinase